MVVATRSLNKALARSRDHTAQLEGQRSQLEHLVEERTQGLEVAHQEAEAARKQAEATNRELQAQIWKIAGLAELQERMYGEQDIAALAGSVIHQLCRTIDAPVGALYVLRGDALELEGSYAYRPRSEHARRFELGEGLVGQVAREGHMRILTGVPQDTFAIASAMGRILPRHVLLLPLLYWENVVGVVEIGLLAELTPVQAEFLQSAADSIANAFHTTLSRERIEELLRRTQQQAEEMQAQEEELRAANEELEMQARALRESARAGDRK